MSQSKLFNVILIFCMLWLAFSGTGAANQALAQTPPPTISSEGEKEHQLTTQQPPVQAFEAEPASDDAPPVEKLEVPPQVLSLPYSGLDANSDSWIGALPHGNHLDQQTSSEINSFALWDNGPLVTNPGSAYNGADASAVQTGLGMGSYGLNVSASAGFRMAEDFEISTASSWQIDTISFYTYQTGTYSYPPASTITGLYLQIWDGAPNDPASSIVFGDLVTNCLIDTYWTSIYQVLDTALLATESPIMAAVASLNIFLPPGTYWLDWTISGSLSSGPWASPISILGQTTTGNAMQYDSNTSAWSPANDLGTGTQQGMPFVIEGTMANWLWDQPLSNVNQNAYVDQEFPDYTTSTSYLSDDFFVTKGWLIDSFYVPGNGWNGFSSLLNATSLNWRIYADNAGFPAGDPTGAGAAPIWSLSLAPTDSQVTISPGYSGYPSDTLLRLTDPIKLPPGHYWLMFYPVMSYDTGGQYGLHPADTTNGNVAKFINPAGGFGYGSTWIDWTALGISQQDIAFSIGGAKDGLWTSIRPINGVPRSRPAAATVDGKIYLIGGEISGNGRANTVDEYDPRSNTWTVQAGLMPIPASNICAAVIGTDIYIPGGYDASNAYLNTLQVYHTTSDSWSTIATDLLPIGLAAPGCAALNGKLYVFGGANAGVYQNGTYVYDPAAPAGSRWSTLPTMAHARAYLAGVAANGKIYAVGGRDVIANDLSYVEAYNPADNAWHSVTSLSKARAGLGVYAVGNTLYACGGGFYGYFDDCEVYETTQGYSGSWTNHPALLIEGRRTFAYANIGPVLYAIGGYNGNYLATAERWSYETYLPAILKTPYSVLGFDSQFNYDATGWYTYAGGYWLFGAGYLYTNGASPNLWSSVSYDANTFTNMDYQARMMRFGCGGCANNLVIRGVVDPQSANNKWNTAYMFQYTRNQDFSVYKVVNGVETALQFWTFSPAILAGDAWNTLRVFASGNQFYFYINDTLVWSGSDTSLTTGKVGLGMFVSNTTGDELRVDWATLMTNAGGFIVSDTVSPEQQALNDAANLQGDANFDINHSP